MSLTRRDFLASSAAAADGALNRGLGCLPLRAIQAVDARPRRRDARLQVRVGAVQSRVGSPSASASPRRK